jgi:uncharacterized protein
MIKWLLVIGVIWFVYQFFIKKDKKSFTKQSSKSQNKTQKEVNEMVECSKCGVFVEIQEAILSNGKYYCSNECLKG